MITITTTPTTQPATTPATLEEEFSLSVGVLLLDGSAVDVADDDEEVAIFIDDFTVTKMVDTNENTKTTFSCMIIIRSHDIPVCILTIVLSLNHFC